MAADETNDEAVASLSSNSRMASAPTGVFAKYIVILIAAALAVVFLGIKPSLEGYFSNNTKTAQQISVNKANEDKHSELKVKQANLTKTEAQVNEFLKSFPSTASQKAMLDELGSIASKNGVTIQSVTPSIAAKGAANAGAGAAPAHPSSDLVAAINIDLTLSGGNTNGFLADLEKASRVFVINSLAFTAGEGTTGETMSLKATTYVVQPMADAHAAEAPAKG